MYMFSYIYHINMVCSMLLRTELRLYHLNLEITRWRYLNDLSQLTKSINQKSNPSTVTTSMYFSSGCTDSPAPRSALYSFRGDQHLQKIALESLEQSLVFRLNNAVDRSGINTCVRCTLTIASSGRIDQRNGGPHDHNTLVLDLSA